MADRVLNIFGYTSLDESDLAYNRQGIISPAQKRKMLHEMTKTVVVLGGFCLLVLVMFVATLLQRETTGGNTLPFAGAFFLFGVFVAWLFLLPSFRMWLKMRQDQDVEAGETSLRPGTAKDQPVVLFPDDQGRWHQAALNPAWNEPFAEGTYRIYTTRVSRNVVGIERIT